jgi:hypothetical protein
VYIMKPLAFNTQPVVKIATEPLNPSELPKMVSLGRGYGKCGNAGGGGVEWKMGSQEAVCGVRQNGAPAVSAAVPRS